MGCASDEYTVAVDPATADEGDIVEHDHAVDRGDELPVADVGHEVGLHYRQSHVACALFNAMAWRVSCRGTN
jgi:hypothetical protein